jgi:hypothetical protein
MSKLGPALVVAALSGMIWLEQGHRTVIEPRTLAAATCADSDDVPYSADCLIFLQGAASDRGIIPATALPIRPPVGWTVAAGAACPDNDNVPYSTRCVEFLSGWYWRAN